MFFSISVVRHAKKARVRTFYSNFIACFLFSTFCKRFSGTGCWSHCCSRSRSLQRKRLVSENGLQERYTTLIRINKRHVIMKPRRPPMTNAHALLDGTETQVLSDKSTHARDHFMHFQEKRHLLGWRSVDDHQLAQTPKEAFSKVRVHAGTTQVDVEVDH